MDLPSKDQLAGWIGTAVVSSDLQDDIAHFILNALLAQDIQTCHHHLTSLIQEVYDCEMAINEEMNQAWGERSVEPS